MAFNIPDLAIDASPVAEGLRLPVVTTDASPIAAGIRLPVVALDASQNIGLKLPKLGFSEASPSTLTVTPSGGVIVEGGADIVGEPVPVSGGVYVSGLADVTVTYVQIFNHNPLGGVSVTGAAENSFYFIEYKPSGGVNVTGAAVVTHISITRYTHIVSGGVDVTGNALISIFDPTGGMAVSGAADIEFVTKHLIPVSGGMQITGAADVDTAISITMSGGVSVAGAAIISDHYPVYVPSGGIVISGLAAVVKLASGETVSPENPFNNLYSGWALSYDDSAPSRYEDLPIDSMCNFKGVTYISNAAGIYKLEKGTDAGRPIRATATVLSNSDFDSKNNKRVPYAYLGYISDDKMRMTVVTNKKDINYYDLMPTSDVDTSRGARAKFGRGLDGLYWTVRISNIDGAFFELDNITIDPVILRKMGV